MRWKWLLQQTLGGVRRLPKASARIVQSGGQENGKCRLGITNECLRALFTSESPVLIFKNALSAAYCHEMAAKLATFDRRDHTNAPTSKATHFSEWRLGTDPRAPASDYTRIGYTKTDVLQDEGIRMAAGRKAPEQYLASAEETRQLLQQRVFAPGRGPIEEIGEELNSLDNVECSAERCPFTRRGFLPYVVRRMTPGGRRQNGNIHMDAMIPGRTFSINVYLQVPEKKDAGGELVLYPVRKDSLSRFLNEHFFTTIDIQNFYPDRTFYIDDILEPGKVEPIIHRPEAGDVVVIDPAYPHGVCDFTASSGRPRVSLQTFMQLSTRTNGIQCLEYAV